MAKKCDYVETDFQKAIRKLTFIEFRDKTNICEIVENGYRNAASEKNVPFTEIGADEMDRYTKHFFHRLYKVHAWHKSALKDLKWKSDVAPSPAPSDSCERAANQKIDAHRANEKKRKHSDQVMSTPSKVAFFCANAIDHIPLQNIDEKANVNKKSRPVDAKRVSLFSLMHKYLNKKKKNGFVLCIECASIFPILSQVQRAVAETVTSGDTPTQKEPNTFATEILVSSK